MAKRKTHEEFIEQLNKIHGDETYTPLEKYINNKTKILVRHNKCGYEWNIIPSNILKGQGCPKCKGGVKKTHEEFVKEIEDKYGNEYEILGEYINAKTKIKVRHNCEKCNNHEWKITPDSLLRGNGCPLCAGTKKKTPEEFIKEVREKYGDEYEILEKYKGNKVKILIRHNSNKCNNHEWKIEPSNLLQGKGCPVCSGNITKLGINTIWDTDRWMVDLGVSEEDTKKYSSRSGQKITVKCPDCGREKKMMISHIYTYKSICCPCGDGKSYPEKFIIELLNQLNVDFEVEYSPKWIENKRYDFYIPKFNMIIEAHGGQHYDKGFKSIGGRTFKEEQLNDKYKRELALQNDIKYYIELNCSESNMNYIKHSILNSELSELFDLNKIDWTSCAEFANKNIVKEVCEYWSNKGENETTSDVGKIFSLHYSTISNYLKRGTRLGWCNYDPKEEMYKQGKLNGKSSKKKVEIFKDGQSLGIFESCTELSRLSEELFGVKLLHSKISSVCRGKRKQHKGFTFKHVIKHL